MATRDSTPQTINVQVQEGNTTRFIDALWLDMTDTQLIAMAKAIHNGRGFTEIAWKYDKTAFPSGLLEFRRVRSKLETAGIIRRVSGAQNATFELTAAGSTGFKAIYQQTN